MLIFFFQFRLEMAKIWIIPIFIYSIWVICVWGICTHLERCICVKHKSRNIWISRFDIELIHFLKHSRRVLILRKTLEKGRHFVSSVIYPKFNANIRFLVIEKIKLPAVITSLDSTLYHCHQPIWTHRTVRYTTPSLWCT